jgi:hypothetical protein
MRSCCTCTDREKYIMLEVRAVSFPVPYLSSDATRKQETATIKRMATIKLIGEKRG